MNCIKGIADLFGTAPCAATALAAIAFVVGAVATCIVCRLRRSCGGGKESCSCAAAHKRPQGAEQKAKKPHPAPADGSIEIYVGNLSYDMTEPQLLAEFVKFGKVASARIITNRFNGKSKGFGFVIMPDRGEAEKAINALSEKEIMGRPMKVNEARNLDKQVLNKD
jgi:hypothetical protein